MTILAVLLALCFVCGFAFTDPVMLAMKREDTIDYSAVEEAGRPLPTLGTLAFTAAFWQTIAAAVVLAALVWCLRGTSLGAARYLVVGLFIVGTLFTAGMVAISPRTPRMLAALVLGRVVAMTGATWAIWRLAA